MTQRDAEILQGFSKILWGATVFRATLSIEHSFEAGYSLAYIDALCLDFHEPLLVPEKIRKHRQVGSLWVGGSSGARLERAGRVLVAKSDSVAKGSDQFSKLVGSHLMNTEVSPPGGDTKFIFDNDLILNCFPTKSQDGNSWVISTADGNRLTLGPGVRVTYETGLR
jgi:hypothetical protein